MVLPLIRRGARTESLTVGGVKIGNVTNVQQSGGMQAPSKKTEKGFAYTSHVQAQPRSATIDAWVEKFKYEQLDGLRSRSEPVDVNVNIVTFKAKVNDVTITNEQDVVSHYKVSIELAEVKQASTGTTTLVIDSESGSLSSAAASNNPTLVRTETKDGPDGTEDNDKSDPLEDVSDWLGF